MPSAGRMDSGANNSGPDDTDNGRYERDWGFETHSRRTFTRLSTLGHDSSASGARSGTHSRWTSTTTTATVKWQVGEHFHFHTTRLKGFSSTEPSTWKCPGTFPTAGGGPQKTKSEVGVGVFLNDFWKRLHYCVKMTSLENCLAT